MWGQGQQFKVSVKYIASPWCFCYWIGKFKSKRKELEQEDKYRIKITRQTTPSILREANSVKKIIHEECTQGYIALVE